MTLVIALVAVACGVLVLLSLVAECWCNVKQQIREWRTHGVRW